MVEITQLISANNEFLTNNNALETQFIYTNCSLNDAAVTIYSNEHNPKDTFTKDAYDNICEIHPRTDHARTDEFGANKQHKLKTVENEISNQCTTYGTPTNENSQKYDIGIDNIRKPVPIMQSNEDQTEKDVNVIADDDKKPKDSDFLSTTILYSRKKKSLKEQCEKYYRKMLLKWSIKKDHDLLIFMVYQRRTRVNKA